LALGALWILLPGERPVDRGGHIDGIGASLGTGGLIVLNVAWKYVLPIKTKPMAHNNLSQAPAVGWSTPYEIALVLLSILMLAIFTIWEFKFEISPIVPLDIWKAPLFLPLGLATLLCFMSFDTLLWYMVAWQQILRQWSTLSFAIGWTSFGIFGTLDAQWILAIGAASVLISNLFLATMPEKQTYWAKVFAATILMAFCPDFVYTSAQIIASNSVRRSQQGVAASLIGTLNLYGNSLGLGFAGTGESEVNKGTVRPVHGYRAALYFGVGIAAVALMVDVL
jgi:hypothetical protein